jgi:putative endonuclease
MWLVYIIETERRTLYTGVTNNLQKRWKKHVAGTGAKYLRANKPVKVVYKEQAKDKSSAMRRECVVKRMSRKQKLELLGT